MKTKFLWILIGIVLMVTSLCSASTMWKASPFYAEHDNVSRAEAVNRVNLWPLSSFDFEEKDYHKDFLCNLSEFGLTHEKTKEILTQAWERI